MNAPPIRWRYRAGQLWEFDGCRIWLEKGRKSTNDLQVMVETKRGGSSVPLFWAALLTDLVYEAEDIAQERPKYASMTGDFKGWKKFLGLLKDIYELGPEAAIDKHEALGEQIELPMFIEVNQNGDA